MGKKVRGIPLRKFLLGASIDKATFYLYNLFVASAGSGGYALQLSAVAHNGTSQQGDRPENRDGFNRLGLPFF